MNQQFWQLTAKFSLVSFIALKVGGTALAAWSWWWLFLSIVPILALIFQHLGVL